MSDPLLQPIQPLWLQLGAGRKFVQIAGILGALAVIAAAYGAHSVKTDAWTSAVLIHFVHTIALLATPLFRRTNLVSREKVFSY